RDGLLVQYIIIECPHRESIRVDRVFSQLTRKVAAPGQNAAIRNYGQRMSGTRSETRGTSQVTYRHRRQFTTRIAGVTQLRVVVVSPGQYGAVRLQRQAGLGTSNDTL